LKKCHSHPARDGLRYENGNPEIRKVSLILDSCLSQRDGFRRAGMTEEQLNQKSLYDYTTNSPFQSVQRPYLLQIESKFHRPDGVVYCPE